MDRQAAISRFIVSQPAQKDLREIIRYVAIDRPLAAENLRRKFITTFERLANQPGMGHRREDFSKNPNLRFWKMERYLIVYTKHPPTGVGIARVLHGSRDIAGLLEDEPPAGE